MSTFIGQLIGFLVIVWIIWKYVVPPLRRLMADQQETVRTQLDESAKAAQRLAAADQHHAKRMGEAKSEAKHIVEEARVDAERIAIQLRAHADAEVERIKVQGAQQIVLLRAQLIRQMRQELGAASIHRASDLVRAHVSDPQAQSATVDRFLDELDSMAPADLAPEIGTSDLRSASRDAQAALVARFDTLSAGLSGYALSVLSDELASVVELFAGHRILIRHLSDATGAVEAKRQLVYRLLAGKVGPTTLDLLDTAVSVRWSTAWDFVGAIEHIARLSLLVNAERENPAGEVEEQLFRFSRVLDAQPGLITLLSRYHTPVAGRVALLQNVLRNSGVSATTLGLLSRTVELLRGERADTAVLGLAQLAAARRGEVVAQVSAAAELTAYQRARLTEVLTRIYNHPISVQLNIDPTLLGGLSVAVGDEVIDGTLASQLAAATTKLPN